MKLENEIKEMFENIPNSVVMDFSIFDGLRDNVIRAVRANKAKKKCKNAEKKDKIRQHSIITQNLNTINEVWGIVYDITELHKDIKRIESLKDLMEKPIRNITRDDYIMINRLVVEGIRCTPILTGKFNMLSALNKKLLKILKND